MDRVRDINGTAGLNPPYGFSSWKDYWEKKKNRKAICCGACGSTEKDNLVGAHIKVYGKVGVYITPLCKGCNNRKGEWFLVSTDLVPVPR